jgi:hypothetical protein
MKPIIAIATLLAALSATGSASVLRRQGGGAPAAGGAPAKGGAPAGGAGKGGAGGISIGDIFSANDLTSGNCKEVLFIFARGSMEPGNMV